MGCAQWFSGGAEVGDYFGNHGSGGHGVDPLLEECSGSEVFAAAHCLAYVGVGSYEYGEDRFEGLGVEGS
ncbi:hypothetical protein AAU01_39050 [Paenarthrobacter aurescens]|uniref:Uncharacterized protein n=1 Tax=Paenarthrobacter aurescens TaxID=43663 RepID=A0A4Y3NH31_PAEAU|nr:hypothetical protein AAU01_39050 [Paenarthrobacter aurescens]